MPELGGGNGGALEVDGGTADYWQTFTCNRSDATAYTSLKISAWTSFGGHRGQTFKWGREPRQRWTAFQQRIVDELIDTDSMLLLANFAYLL